MKVEVKVKKGKQASNYDASSFGLCVLLVKLSCTMVIRGHKSEMSRDHLLLSFYSDPADASRCFWTVVIFNLNIAGGTTDPGH